MGLTCKVKIFQEQNYHSFDLVLVFGDLVKILDHIEGAVFTFLCLKRISLSNFAWFWYLKCVFILWEQFFSWRKVAWDLIFTTDNLCAKNGRSFGLLQSRVFGIRFLQWRKFWLKITYDNKIAPLSHSLHFLFQGNYIHLWFITLFCIWTPLGI